MPYFSRSTWYVRYFIQLMVTRAEARATKYLFHKGDNLYINVRTREVTFSVGGSHQIATSSKIKRIGNLISRIFVNQTFVMEKENFEEIKNLVTPINQHHTWKILIYCKNWTNLFRRNQFAKADLFNEVIVRTLSKVVLKKNTGDDFQYLWLDFEPQIW